MCKKKEEIEMYRSEIRSFASRLEMEFEKHTQEIDIGVSFSYIGKGVKAKKSELTNEYKTVLNVVFDENGFIGRHCHRYQEETIFVLSGELYDFVNDVRLTENDVYIIEPKKPHGFTSNKCDLLVKFKPPSKIIQLDAKVHN